MALVIVLASLVLLAALALAFLASVNTELQSSKVYSQGANAKLLSQTAVNLAIAQISEATKGVDSSGKPLAWASQPGMIRTYDAAGIPTMAYKLYSWNQMTTAGAFDSSATNNQIPTAWSTQPAIFTDLNQPIKIPGTNGANVVYPVLDGNNLAPISGSKTYDANGDNKADIEGFSVSASAPTASGSGANPVPMPVKWLYVLENGKIAPPTSSTSNEATVAGASATNQIVGRIAFWTDDESCKVNVNTASEGSYMDMPRFNSSYDMGPLAKYQAVQNEFQRYPGHPAMTSLSTIFPSLTAETIYKVTPRVAGGGSMGGTVASTTPITITPNRLYATVDELLFSPTMSAGSRRTNDAETGSDALESAALEQAKFFITTTSRSPEVNLFNRPRVDIWPVSLYEDSSHRTVRDQLFAFCSTMRNDLQTPFRFYFQRSDATNATTDLPTGSSTTGLERNRMLLDYLKKNASQAIPGFGGDFKTKYGSDFDQIFTEIFDYIRCINLRDPVTKTDSSFVPFAGPLSGTKSGGGQVTPIVDTVTNTRGFGRFPTVSKAFFQFIGTATNSTNSSVPAGKLRVQAAFFLEMFDPSFGFVGVYPYFKIRVTGLDGFQWGGAPYGTTSPMGFPASATLNPPGTDAFNLENFVGGPMGYSILAYGKGWSGANRYPFVSQTIDLPDPANSGTAATDKFFDFSGGSAKIEILDASSGAVVQTLTLDFPAATQATNRFPTPKLAPNNVPESSQPDFRSFYNRINSSITSGSTGFAGACWIVDGDIVRSVEANPGDIRLIAARATVSSADNLFSPHANYFLSGKSMAHSLRTGQGNPYRGATFGKLVNVSYYGVSGTEYWNSGNSGSYAMQGSVWDLGNPSSSGVALGKATPFATGDIPGDWDTGFGNQRDGPYINKPDEGDTSSGSNLAYYGDLRYVRNNPGTFSPNRQIPSAVMFGSLPTGVQANRPWQTLLFRPDPAGTHPGSKNRKGDGSSLSGMPADHLLLDLFQMPVVEPYAVSEPLSTAGKVNINYQILPFDYIRRDSGIRAVLKSEKLISVQDADANVYKSASAATSKVFRQDLNVDETLKGFDQRFSANDIFRSATEICELPLVPSGATASSMSTYWNTRRLTGDNLRERPYATIYPRITTRSNTFTVHFRVQSLKKAPGGPADTWSETRDKVTGEYRGAQIVERYIDPNDSAIPDYADSTTNTPIGIFYRYRVLLAKQFTP